MSYIKKLRESKKILEAAREILQQHQEISLHIEELQNKNGELLDLANQLLDKHNKMMANLDLDSPEVELTIEAPLQVHTTRGNFPVGSACPMHNVVHSDKGRWYVCVDDGFVDVTGWYPIPKKGSR